MVINRPAASHRGHAARRTSRALHTQRFGKLGFVGLMLLPVALLFGCFHHAIESAETRFQRSLST